MSVKGELNYSGFSEKLRQEILKELLALSEHLLGLIQQYVPEASTILKGSFGYSVKETDVGVALEVGSPMEYGAYVEFGTKPHNISAEGFEGLVKWVDELQLDMKGRTEKGYKTRASRKVKKGRKFSPREAQIRSIAYAIKMKIKREGTQGKFYMERSLKELGLEYTVAPENDEMVYSVDLAKFLEPRMNALIERSELKK